MQKNPSTYYTSEKYLAKNYEHKTHISPVELGFNHRAKVREPRAPIACEGGVTTHPSSLG